MTALPRTTFAALRLWVLAWFVASMGMAIASPLVNPQSFEVICSGTGAIKLLVHPVLVLLVGSAAYLGFAFWLHARWIGVAPFLLKP